MSAGHLFCFGLGYSAQVLAQNLVARGWRVSGTSRSDDKVAALRGQGIEAYVFDDGRPVHEFARVFSDVTHVLSSVPPSENADPVLDAHDADIIAGSERLEWIGYLSTIGVYGDQKGRWVNESSPPAPITDASRRRVDAESRWLALGASCGVPAHVFRLPGIYGPNGRSQIDALRSGRARRILKPGQVFNRIHVEDLAAVLYASMELRDGSSVYNVTDNEPAPADRVVAYAARLLGVEPPPVESFNQAELPPFAAHFYAECKRVRNDLIKRELGIALRYPSYREGLAAILEQPG